MLVLIVLLMTHHGGVIPYPSTHVFNIVELVVINTPVWNTQINVSAITTSPAIVFLTLVSWVIVLLLVLQTRHRYVVETIVFRSINSMERFNLRLTDEHQL